MCSEILCFKLSYKARESSIELVQICCYYTFFFFQAEDGIRDVAVTGVQTCALPIFHFDCELFHAWVTIKLRAQITNRTGPLSYPGHNLLVIALALLRRQFREITVLGVIITAIILPREPDPGQIGRAHV